MKNFSQCVALQKKTLISLCLSVMVLTVPQGRSEAATGDAGDAFMRNNFQHLGDQYLDSQEKMDFNALRSLPKLCNDSAGTLSVKAAYCLHRAVFEELMRLSPDGPDVVDVEEYLSKAFSEAATQEKKRLRSATIIMMKDFDLTANRMGRHQGSEREDLKRILQSSETPRSLKNIARNVLHDGMNRLIPEEMMQSPEDHFGKIQRALYALEKSSSSLFQMLPEEDEGLWEGIQEAMTLHKDCLGAENRRRDMKKHNALLYNAVDGVMKGAIAFMQMGLSSNIRRNFL
jgi:hypothetical protein